MKTWSLLVAMFFCLLSPCFAQEPSWTQNFPPTSPVERYARGMAYNAATPRVSERIDSPAQVATASASLQARGPSNGPHARLAESYGRLPLSFEVNKGQSDASVKFMSRGHGYSLFLTNEEAVLSLRSQRSGAMGHPPEVNRGVVSGQLS